LAVQSLTTADPATIFISYCREDKDAVLPIEQALQARGVHVVRDEPSLALGAHNVDGLMALIDLRCDAIIFYVTQQFLASIFIWRYEVPRALARRDRDPLFHIIPVCQGVSFDELALACADRGLRSLAEFNAQRVQGAEPSVDEVRAIAKRSLKSALALRVARGGGQEEVPAICLRTFSYSPPTSRLHLDLDWSGFFEAGVTPEIWAAQLLPALSDAVEVLGSQFRAGPLDVWVKARLPAALALGHALAAKGPFRLRLNNERGVWLCDGPSPAPDDLSVISTPLRSDQPVAVVELAISRETAPSVTQWRSQSNVSPRWRIHAAPSVGANRAAIGSDSQARAWARRIGDSVRELWDREHMHDVHLFLASPSEFAVMVGQQIRDRHPVHVYYGDNQTGYRLAYTLGME
jgi:hypothetical protein